MGTSYLDRWIDLAAELLSHPFHHDPMVDLVAGLSAQFDAVAAGTIDYSEPWARIATYRCPSRLDPALYLSRIGDHPLSRHFRETRDVQARGLAAAERFLAEPSARAMIGSLRDDGLRDFVYVPLRSRQGMAHRWLGIAGADLGMAARDDVERLRPLIQAIDAHRLAFEATLAHGGPGVGTAAGLSGRETAVLGLVADGLTAHAIGDRLGISPRTASKHQGHIYRKLGVGDRLSAVLRAQALGIIPGPLGRLNGSAGIVGVVEGPVAGASPGDLTRPRAGPRSSG